MPALNPTNQGRQTSAAVLPASPLFHQLHFAALILCVLWFVLLAVMNLAGLKWPASLEWCELMFPMLAAGTTFAAHCLRLPLQNVVTVSVLITVLSCGAQAVGVQTSLPFGPYIYAGDFGWTVFGLFSWPAPVLWLVVILACRGMARLILRPWRKLKYYGFWIMGLAGLLAVLLDVSLQPYCTQFKRYWLWLTPETLSSWHHIPWTNFLGRFATTVCILAFATPWLINKQPHKQPADYHPLIVWWLLQLLFLSGNVAQHLWSAAAVSLVASTLVTVLAWRGGRA